MTRKITNTERTRLYKTRDMAVRLAQASDDGIARKWNIAIRYATFETENQSRHRLTIEELGREGLVLSMEWTAGGDMTVQEYHPGEWEAPLRDDAPALLL
jgi:hypothetical protein